MLLLPRCIRPWSNLALFPDQTMMPCCHLFKGGWPKKFTYSETIGDIWTSGEFRRLRHEMVDNPSGNPCAKCKLCTQGTSSGWIDGFYADESSVRKKNYRSAIEAFAMQKEDIATMPSSCLFFFGYACNIRCITCNRDIMHNSIGKELDADWLISNAEYLQKTASITISGGEPFVLPNAVKFMDWLFGDALMKDVLVSIQTNGLAMESFIPSMKNHNVLLAVSLDSYGKYYDLVRRGSSWERVSANIDAYLYALGGRQIIKGESNVVVMCTLTRTGLPGLFDLTKWAVDRGLRIHYNNADYREGIDLSNESFGMNPKLVHECGNWRDIMLGSIEYIEANSLYPHSSASLKSILAGLDRDIEVVPL